MQAWGSLLSGLRREEWRSPSSHCSVPSLAAGVLFGSLAGLGAYQLYQDPRNVWGFLAATSVTFVGVMGMRSYYYGKFMPVGLIAGASLLMAAKVGVRMLMTSD
ncbi:transmembrane protein 14B isoform X4 [Gorilla gorilla gorilla]|uniref:Transmembrane protein 14B n=1 Tax=Gorilla gorilla gorilla TaxID=9595 RepID=A0A2I2ZCS9_GORGO|nr:transmembrane protein 14B isoform X4 [Gorilla gorilla gorilla]